MKAVDLVFIEKLLPIYKNGEEATSIQVARVKDTEGNSCEFNIIVGKGLYELNDQVLYIMPDFCIPDNDMFSEYWRPGGDPGRSRLGKRGRIRALKFNFTFENDVNPIYSNGIIMPLTNDMLNIQVEELQEKLGVIKYVADDSFENGGQNSGATKSEFPSFLYKTDENRIELLKGHINRVAEEGIEIAATIKRDGSSFTSYNKIDMINNVPVIGICTRNQEKELDQKYVSGYKNELGVSLRPHFNRETKEKGWFDDSTEKFYTNDEVLTSNFEPEIKEHRDTWIDTAKKIDVINKLSDYCEKYNVQLALRGELIGKGNKGSGNKLNMDAKLSDSTIVFFGIDDLSSGHSERIHYGSEHNLAKVCDELGLDYTKEVFSGVFTYDELIKKAEEFFANHKAETGNIIEGLVFRSKYSNSLSTKYINPEYDSKS